MLAQIVPQTNDFHALSRYLMHGRDAEVDPKRVAWVFAQNLPTNDPLRAATIMEATAHHAPRTKNAVYHLMVAWHQRENPADDIMQEIATRTLALAGLSEHQALIMGHGDKPHKHFHVMLNRVHPETFRAWAPFQDYKRFETIMRQLSAEYGFDYVPSHRYNPELTDELPQQPGRRAKRAADRGAKTNRTKWSRNAAREFGKYLADRITPEPPQQDVHRLLGEHGLSLQAKGRGHVIGNNNSYATLSSIGLTVSGSSLTVKPPIADPTIDLAKPLRHRRHWFEVDQVDVTRAFMSWGLADRDDLIEAINEVRAERAASISARSHATTALSIPAFHAARTSQRKPFQRRQPKPALNAYGIHTLIRQQTNPTAIAAKREIIRLQTQLDVVTRSASSAIYRSANVYRTPAAALQRHAAARLLAATTYVRSNYWPRQNPSLAPIRTCT